LGLRRTGGRVDLKPCLPADWPGVTLKLRLDDAEYDIQILRGDPGAVSSCTLDDHVVNVSDGAMSWAIATGEHVIRWTMAAAG